LELGAYLSAGQAALVPVQLSGTSHGPAGSRHKSVDGSKRSGGHWALTPSQNSATSHAPATRRQRPNLTLSFGQAALVPVQFSATSQVPAEERQTVAAETKLSAGQAPLVPVHVSAVSQTPAGGRQVVPDATFVHAVVLTVGWHDWQLFGAVFVCPAVWDPPPMWHPAWQRPP